MLNSTTMFAADHGESMAALRQMVRAAACENKLTGAARKKGLDTDEARLSAGLGERTREAENDYYLSVLEPMAWVESVAGGSACDLRMGSAHPAKPSGIKAALLRGADGVQKIATRGYDKVRDAARFVNRRANDMSQRGLAGARTKLLGATVAVLGFAVGAWLLGRVVLSRARGCFGGKA